MDLGNMMAIACHMHPGRTGGRGSRRIRRESIGVKSVIDKCLTRQSPEASAEKPNYEGGNYNGCCLTCYNSQSGIALRRSLGFHVPVLSSGCGIK